MAVFGKLVAPPSRLLAGLRGFLSLTRGCLRNSPSASALWNAKNTESELKMWWGWA